MSDFEPTGLGLSIFKERYTAHAEETWQGACQRVARAIAAAENGSAPVWEQTFYEELVSGRFMPGGRIWVGAGQKVQQLLNCVSGDTMVQTVEGLISARDLAGREVATLSQGGVYRMAKWKSYGEQELYRVVFANGDEIEATAGHEWVVTKPEGGDERVTTSDLAGRRVPMEHVKNFVYDEPSYAEGIRHGLIYGDGTINHTGKASMVQFGDSRHLVEDYFEGGSVQKNARFPEGVTYVGALPAEWKGLPSESSGPSYIRGFIAGLMAADGCVDSRGHAMIHAADFGALVEIRRLAASAGLPTTSIKMTREFNPWTGERSPVYKLSFVKAAVYSERMILKQSHRDKMFASSKPAKRQTMKVEAVLPTGRVETVYCCEEPETNTWVAGAGYLTSNCFVVPTEDSIGGWGKTISDTLTISSRGGGVGINFSPVRGRDYPIRGMRGSSTGSLSPMQMIDRAGDILVGGGNRRMALMLCLNINHPDVEEFMSKKLNKEELNNANVSVVLPADFKTEDFVKLVKEDGDIPLMFNGVPDVFGRSIKAKDLWHKVVENAWNSGEPGFLNGHFANKMNNIWYHKPLISTNPCFTADQRLLTENGYETFGALYENGGTNVVLADNRVSYHDDGRDEPSENWHVTPANTGDVVAREASHVFLTRESAEVVRLRFDNGMELRCTPKHRILTSEGAVEAQNLTSDHNVLMSLPSPTGSVVDSIPETADEKASFLMGMIAGDGCVSYMGKSKTPMVAVDIWGDETMVDHCVDLIESLHAEHAPEGASDRGGTRTMVACNIIRSASGRKDKVRIQSAWLANFLRSRYGFTKDTKHVVPEIVLSQARTDVGRYYLAAMYYCDGTVFAGGSSTDIRLAQSNKTMLQDIQRVLHANGIPSRLHLRRPAGERMMPDGNGGQRMYAHRDQYELITGRGRTRFSETIGFAGSAKDTKLSRELERIHERPLKGGYVRLESREEDGREDVFCIKEQEGRNIVVSGISAVRCGEIWLEEYGCCCLGALVLPRFVVDGKFDWDAFDISIRNGVRFLDNVLEVNHYPLPEIEKNCKEVRRIGLGVMGLHTMLLKLGMKYNSEEAYEFVDKLFAFKKNTEYDESVTLAAVKGPFPAYNPKFLDSGFAKTLKRGIRSKIKQYGIRNCALSTVAPTGTTSMVQADHEGMTGGIEPDFAPAYFRRRTVSVDKSGKPKKVKTLVVSANYLNYPELAQGAYDITPEDHFRMQVVVQKHTDNAVSKTINLPEAFPVEGLADTWLEHLGGMKGSTIYRQGSRGEEPQEHIPVADIEKTMSEWEGEVDYQLPESLECPSGVCEVPAAKE